MWLNEPFFRSTWYAFKSLEEGLWLWLWLDGRIGRVGCDKNSALFSKWGAKNWTLNNCLFTLHERQSLITRPIHPHERTNDAVKVARTDFSHLKLKTRPLDLESAPQVFLFSILLGNDVLVFGFNLFCVFPPFFFPLGLLFASSRPREREKS